MNLASGGDSKELDIQLRGCLTKLLTDFVSEGRYFLLDALELIGSIAFHLWVFFSLILHLFPPA